MVDYEWNSDPSDSGMYWWSTFERGGWTLPALVRWNALTNNGVVVYVPTDGHAPAIGYHEYVINTDLARWSPAQLPHVPVARPPIPDPHDWDHEAWADFKSKVVEALDTEESSWPDMMRVLAQIAQGYGDETSAHSKFATEHKAKMYRIADALMGLERSIR